MAVHWLQLMTGVKRVFNYSSGSVSLVMVGGYIRAYLSKGALLVVVCSCEHLYERPMGTLSLCRNFPHTTPSDSSVISS